MDRTEVECVCGEKVSGSPKCPACGKELAAPSTGSMGLSESAIDATYEVMAEEGAIWSGAR